MLRYAITALTLAGTWVLWSWHFEPLIIAVGVISILLTTTLVSRLHVLDAEGMPFEINFRLLAFLPWLVWQVILANIQVARIILKPKMGLRPHLIRVPAPQRTALGRVMFANTITITPGTISLDVRDDVILVHALTDDMADQESTGDTAKVLCWLEAKLPDDPPAVEDAEAPSKEVA